jgi:hypothetical protein
MQIATYKEAKRLRAALERLHVKFKPETLDMKTSGIYIPRWQGYSRIPHRYHKASGVAEWFFFFRFTNGHPDINVGEVAHAATKPHGLKHLAHRINHWRKK